MCGIIGLIGNENVIPVIINGLKMLQNRGYDSAGISINKDNKIIFRKYASSNTSDSIKNLEENIKELSGCNGIGHTRWATHGGKTDNNAHPHISMNGDFSVVHNGIIENYLQIKKDLINKGYSFKSETDTEVIVNLTEYYYNKTKDIVKTLEIISSILEGTWAVLIQSIHFPNLLIAMRNGSPLLFAGNKHGYIFASEASALGQFSDIENYINIQDKGYLIVDKENDKLYTKKIKRGVNLNNLISESNIDLMPLEKGFFKNSPEPYDHWMLKEIYDQIESSQNAINNGGRLEGPIGIKLGGLEKYSDVLLKYKSVAILACGTSYHAGVYGSIFFNYLKSFRNINYYDASEFYSYLVDSNTLYLVISQSGETKDVHRCMELIRKQGGKVLSIVNVVESLIAREALCGVYTNAGHEKGVASTKSFTNQVIVLTLIAMWFYKSRKKEVIHRNNMVKNIKLDLVKLKNSIKKTIDENKEKAISIAKNIKNQKSIFILGRGFGYPIALEAALKIKEIGYIHAEGYCGGGLKHGPFALIEDGTPIFILNFDDEHKNRMETAAEEVKCRGANVILVTDNIELYKKEIYNDYFLVDRMHTLSSLLGIIPFQLLSYYIALEKGHNPDFPRNLAKVVTVDG